MIRLHLLWRRRHEVQQSGPHPTTTLALIMALLQTIFGAIAATVRRNKKRT
jgi:hypothetical protein